MQCVTTSTRNSTKYPAGRVKITASPTKIKRQKIRIPQRRIAQSDVLNAFKTEISEATGVDTVQQQFQQHSCSSLPNHQHHPYSSVENSSHTQSQHFLIHNLRSVDWPNRHQRELLYLWHGNWVGCYVLPHHVWYMTFDTDIFSAFFVL